MTDEGACQMALISEACCECGLSWSVICSEEPPREQNTTLNQVGVRTTFLRPLQPSNRKGAWSPAVRIDDSARLRAPILIYSNE